MFSDKMHLLIEGLDALHVGSCIVSQLDLLAAADALCTPVEVSHVYWASDLAGDCVESCLPSLYRLACSLRCKCKVHYLAGLHFPDDAEDNVAASLSVNRDTSELTEKPSERTPEELSLYHAVRLATYGNVIKI